MSSKEVLRTRDMWRQKALLGNFVDFLSAGSRGQFQAKCRGACPHPQGILRRWTATATAAFNSVLDVLRWVFDVFKDK
jgi:hypothetical protein